VKVDEQVRDSDLIKRSDEEYAEINARDAVIFYGVAGIFIAIAGIYFGFFTNLYTMALAIPLGFIVMGIGSIISAIQRSARK
jgi:hypothetical protein